MHMFFMYMSEMARVRSEMALHASDAVEAAVEQIVAWSGRRL